ncbi:tetratricopeptide repeat protein [Rhodanobacter sp. TND4EL1]
MGYARVTFLLLMIPVFAGCSMLHRSKTKPNAIHPYDQLMQDADARYNAQDVDGAKALYTKAAAADPTRETPWYRLAQINFDQQNYGRAIVEAQEVLQRNPSDTHAESILTVAGLRVAVQALERLHDESNQQGPAHVEAEKLAAKMRDTLGQDVLVPPEAMPAERAPARRRVTTRRAAPTPPPATTPKPAAPPSTPASDNPFQALPGGSL